jgi:anti-sigma factor RsiW
MRHEEVRALAGAYLDGEADPLARAELEGHLAGCAACRQAIEAARGFSAALRAEAEYYEAPEGLAARLAAAAAAAEPGTALPRMRSRRVWLRSPALAMAASLALVAVLSGGIGYFSAGTAPQDGVLEQVVDSHVRSLLAQHLTDVASSDQHTVKPWFNGRIDGAPPVRDLAAEGFPLIGGRLDYLDGRPVAALVYRHGQHPINLFVWPRREGSAQPALATERRGYNIRHWSAGDLDYWLVSDLEMAELAQLEELLRRP